jgi:MFS family permease
VPSSSEAPSADSAADRRPSRFGALSVLRNRAYREWVAADFVSGVGTWGQTVAVNWLVFKMTGSSAALGASVALSILPGLLLGLPAGSLVDRIRVVPLLRVTQLSQGVLAGVLAALVFTGNLQLWHLWVAAALAGTLNLLNGPALGRMLADLLSPSELPKAVAVGSLAHSCAWVMGMGAAGVLISAWGPGLVFAVNAVSYAATTWVLGRLQHEPMRAAVNAPPDGRGVRAGLSYLRRAPHLVALLTWLLVGASLGRHFNVTMPAMVSGPLHGSPAMFGAMSAVFAAGAFAGAALAAAVPVARLRVFLIAASTTAALQIACGLAPNAWTYGAGLFTAAASAVTVDTAFGAYVQLWVDGRFRGRVLAIQSLTASVAGAVGAPTLGKLADVLGPRLPLLLGGAVTLAATAATLGFLTRLTSRRLAIA